MQELFISFLETEGYVRNEFANTNKKKSTEFRGAITNGTYNLDLTILNYTYNIEQGTKICVVGEVEELGKKLHFDYLYYSNINIRK